MSEKLLEVKNLAVSYHGYAGEVQSSVVSPLTFARVRPWQLSVSPAAASPLLPSPLCV